ncbi:MAG: hypothetical protein P4L93_00830 [Coriobacteriia bacterium]|nr:hypothetical protein [Coriobacteriia bacterium]
MSSSQRSSRVVGIAIVAISIVAAVILPPAALAASGDSESHAVPLTIGTSTPGTLTQAPSSSADYLFVYSVNLTAGQTIAATYTVSPAITDPDVLAWASFRTDVAWLGSAWISPTSRVTHLLAPKSGTYYLGVFGRSTPGTFTIDTSLAPPIEYTLSKMVAPSRAKKTRSFKVSSTLIGQFDEFNVPVSFLVMRKSGRLFKPYRTVKATLASRTDGRHTLFSARLKLPKGTYQVRARFLDAAHSVPLKNLPRTVTVN